MRNGSCGALREAVPVPQPVAKVSDVPPGAAKKVEVDGVEVLLCNVDGKLYAVEDVCTHDGGPLDQGELQGRRIMCPRHGALFDVTTGAALTLPAVVPLQTYDARVEGDDVFVDV
jgi:3-phenylpropionate/trans-cinnamate dioxygenase ferredoxin subunit